MIIAITMAGLGSRFRKAGYARPKHEIAVQGKSLFYWSVSSLRNFFESSRFVFIARKEDDAFSFITMETAKLGILNRQVIEIEKLTDGQATTALAAQTAIPDSNSPFMVYNIDTYVEPMCLSMQSIRGDGWIPCFPGLGDAWSFARADADGRVTEVREKVRISDHATIGLYYFSSFALYRAAYDEYYGDPNNLEKGEKYIAPLYNCLIHKSLPVFIETVPRHAVHPLGTPEEVERFAVKRDPN